MQEQGITRAELARRLGTSQAYITRVLSGNANFTLKTISKLAMALGMELEIGLHAQSLPSAARRAEDERSIGPTPPRSRAAGRRLGQFGTLEAEGRPGSR